MGVTKMVTDAYLWRSRFGPNTIPKLLGGMKFTFEFSRLPTLPEGRYM